MAEHLNIPENVIPGSALDIGQIILWIKGLGLIIIIWILYSIIMYLLNRKRLKALLEIEEDVKIIKKDIKRIEKKILRK